MPGPKGFPNQNLTPSSGGIPSATASGTDTYTATISPAPSSYVAGASYLIKFTNANTGSATLNLNSLGAKTLKKFVSSNLTSGDLAANQEYICVYDGTNFQIIGISLNSKIYKSLVEQDGTPGDNPTANVLQNSLGTVTYSYNSLGTYDIISTAAFPDANKIFTQFESNDGASAEWSVVWIDVNTIQLINLLGTDGINTGRLYLEVFP